MEKELTGERQLRFTLSAKDAVSGAAVVQRMIYNEADVRDGDFRPGESLDPAEA